MPVTLSDYLVINQGGTPGTAGTGAYFVASIADVFNPALSQVASADPATLTAYEGSIIWFAGEPYIWNGAAYEPVRMANLDPRLQAGTLAPTTRGDATPLADGDLWYDTTADMLKVYETGAWTAVANAGGASSAMVDNGDNTITHTAGDGTTFTMMKAPTHYTAPAAPTTPYVGDTWYDTSNSKVFLRTNDGTNDIWQDITGGAGSSGLFDWQSSAGDPTGVVTLRSDATSALVEGDQCWDSTNDALYAWDGSAWILVGPSTVAGATHSVLPASPFSGTLLSAGWFHSDTYTPTKTGTITILYQGTYSYDESGGNRDAVFRVQAGSEIKDFNMTSDSNGKVYPTQAMYIFRVAVTAGVPITLGAKFQSGNGSADRMDLADSQFSLIE
jgi:hypothetical protein